MEGRLKMKILLIVGYDGTNFSGWQRQKEKRTVQGEIELSLVRCLGKKVVLKGVGRTDSGVHARIYPCSFEIDELDIPAGRLCYVLQKFLPADIISLSSWQVRSNFDVRYDVEWKSYRYFLYSGIRSVAMDRFAVFVDRVDKDLISNCCEEINGEVDFQVFACKEGRGKRVRGKLSCKFFWDDEMNLGFIEVKSYGFLYKMVRRIVGLCLDILSGRFSVDVIRMVKEGEYISWMTAEARGLWLWNVKFKEDGYGIAEKIMLGDRSIWL